MTAAALSPLEELAERAVAEARRRAPSAKVEVYAASGEDRTVELREGRLESLQRSAGGGVGVRVLEGERCGFAYSVGVDLEGALDAFARARAQLSCVSPDPNRTLPAPCRAVAPAGLLESLTDPSLFQAPLHDVLPRLRAMEAQAASGGPRIGKVLRASYGESRGETVLRTSTGAAFRQEGTHCSAGLSVTAVSGGEIQVGSAAVSGRRFTDLDLDGVGKDAAWRAAAVLDGRKLPTARRSIVFDPWVAGELMDLIAGLLSAEEVQRGKSLLAGKAGRRVASPLVSIIDDPLIPGGLASCVEDDEGVPARRKTLIEAGVLREYFHDSYTAAKDKVATNASAGRASFRGTPGPGPTNFFLAPGPMTRDALIASTVDGVLALELMGMHMVDPISGELSVGVSGIAIEGGRLTHAVKGAMLAGSLLELLEKVDGVADDLTFYGSLAAPTFRASDMTLA